VPVYSNQDLSCGLRSIIPTIQNGLLKRVTVGFSVEIEGLVVEFAFVAVVMVAIERLMRGWKRELGCHRKMMIRTFAGQMKKTVEIHF